jgi:hypothetical protein
MSSVRARINFIVTRQAVSRVTHEPADDGNGVQLCFSAVIVLLELDVREADQSHTGMTCACFVVMAKPIHTARGVSVMRELFV